MLVEDVITLFTGPKRVYKDVSDINLYNQYIVDSCIKAQIFLHDVSPHLSYPTNTYQIQDVTLLLEDVMETDFNTVCEDESCDELGDLLCTMWRGR